MTQEKHGKRLVIECIWDSGLPHDYQHFDPTITSNYASVFYEMFFHYEGQTRKRKVSALVSFALENTYREYFDDIRKCIGNNTIELYTRGFKTPSAFYPFIATVPLLEQIETK